MKYYSLKLLKMNRKDIKAKLKNAKNLLELSKKNAPQLTKRWQADIKFYNTLLDDLNKSILTLTKA